MEYIRVVMIRPDMENIPQHALPAGYSLRPYRDGDRRTWIDIEQASEPFAKITPETFDREFGPDLPAMPQRCFFLVGPDGRDAGTITAWYDHAFAGQSWGRIHWLAIAPEHRNRGLAKPLTTVAMNRLRDLGHTQSMLVTQTPRLAAIKIYLDFGFVPDMAAPDAARAWRLVAEALPHPALAGHRRP